MLVNMFFFFTYLESRFWTFFSKGIENPTSGIGRGHFTGTKTGANVIKRRTARFQTGRLRGHGPEISGGFSGRS